MTLVIWFRKPKNMRKLIMRELLLTRVSKESKLSTKVEACTPWHPEVKTSRRRVTRGLVIHQVDRLVEVLGTRNRFIASDVVKVITFVTVRRKMLSASGATNLATLVVIAPMSSQNRATRGNPRPTR